MLASRLRAVAVAICTAAASLVVASPAAALTPPANDPFYQPPTNYASQPNGAVLRTRTVTVTALSVPLPATATQILFKSVDAHKSATAEVVTVMVPTAPWLGSGPRPIVSYQTAEDSVGSQCEPSYALRAGATDAGSLSAMESPVIGTLIARGWAVVTTDYEGPHSQFLAGPQEGYGVLDGIRAALAAHSDRLSPTAPVALWGYSGGAFATAWAMALRAAHWPQFHPAGVALGGIPADLKTTMINVDGGYAFGLVFGGFIGLNRAYPEVNLASLLNSAGRAELARSADACTSDLITRYTLQRLSDYTVTPNPYANNTWSSVLNSNSPPAARVSTPVYSYHASADEIVPVSVANAFVAKYCARGDTVQIVRTPGGSHNTELLTGAPGAISFLTQRFAGDQPTNNCSD
jgi:hypothetical protein